MKVADIHTHIFPNKIAQKASGSIGEFYCCSIPHTASLEVLVEQEQLAGIRYFAASSSATNPSQVRGINTFIAQCAAEQPGMVGFGSLFPTMVGWEEELETIVQFGIRGIKIHPDFQKVPIDEPSAIDMYRGIAKQGLPVLFHMGDSRYDYSAPERLTNLIRQVPDLIAIAAHFGGWQAWDKAYAHVLPENVFYDTSSSLMYLGKERALDYLDKLGAHRFLFGSDFPMWTPRQELDSFLALDLDETTQDRILYGNFASLFLTGR